MFLFLLTVLSILPRFALSLTVNHLNGSANIVYVDFSLRGSTLPHELIRSYNSITSLSESTGWQGALGWGWTSEFETTLQVTPEREAVLRDGATGNSIFFKRIKDNVDAKQEFYDSVKRAYFEQKQGRKLTPDALAKLEMPASISSRLRTDSQFRNEFARKVGVKGDVPTGEALVSTEFGYQTLLYKDKLWFREKEGITQVFDQDGTLSKQIDKNGAHFVFRYSPVNRHQLAEISSSDKSTSLKLKWRQDRVVEIVDNKNKKAKYTYDNFSNLIGVTDSENQTYIYKYENRKYPHLLTRIEYLSEGDPKSRPYREMRYDDATGMLISHRDKDGSEYAYSYGKSSSDPENNFWTKITYQMRNPGDLPVEQYDEFFLKRRVDGSKYLYKQETRQTFNKGSPEKIVKTTTLLTECCGKPSQIIRNGEVTQFKYYENGLLKEKVGAKEEVRLEYDRRWKKVSKVVQNGFVSSYAYDGRGNLVRASNARNESVSLVYDRLGKIKEMVAVSNGKSKKLGFIYADGRPTLIEQQGVGKIRLAYDRLGKLIKAETLLGKANAKLKGSNQSQEVVKVVMMGFENLMNILRPAAQANSYLTLPGRRENERRTPTQDR